MDEHLTITGLSRENNTKKEERDIGGQSSRVSLKRKGGLPSGFYYQ